MDVFRITDRFKITGKGMLYTIKVSKGAVLHVNDILCDLSGNRFMVEDIEMFRRNMADLSSEDWQINISFKPLSGSEVNGNILVRDLTKVNFLFCNHPLYPCRVDEDYKEEYQAAGLEHLLPGWYKDFSEETVETVWTSGNNVEDVIQLAKRLDEGSYIVKDYVKSRKHEWYDACLIKNIKDRTALQKVVTNFIERQGEDLVGGIVLRKYADLRKAGFHERSGMPLSEEYRVFVYAGRVLAIDDYWKEEAELQLTEEEFTWIDSIAARVKSNFVTVDLARKEDGSLIIMEFGDGQVSGLQQLKAEEFYRTF